MSTFCPASNKALSLGFMGVAWLPFEPIPIALNAREKIMEAGSTPKILAPPAAAVPASAASCLETKPAELTAPP